MKFEHLIEINDLNNENFPILTREQLWNGLVLRAEFSTLFVSHLDACTVTARDLDSLTRILQFGDRKIIDRVHYNFLNYVHYQVHKQDDIPESSLRMTIEEPVPLALSIRFSYESPQNGENEAENNLFDEYRFAAYKESDIETVRILREMHRARRLDSLLT